MTRWAIFLLVLLLTIATTLSASDKLQEAQALMSHASELSNLQAGGPHPFRLRLHWNSPVLSPSQGSYVLRWKDREHWREEFLSANGTLVRVAADGKLSAAPETAQSLPWFTVERLLQKLWKLDQPLAGKVARLSERSVKEMKLKCVEWESKYSLAPALCFDSSGTLLTVHNGDDDWQYTNYAPFNGRVFPRRMDFFIGHSLVLDAEVEELANEDDASGSLLALPTGAKETPLCTATTAPAEPISSPGPDYPALERSAHRQGAAKVYMLIGVDGMVQDAVAVEAGSKNFGEAAVAAVKRWRYKPATCNGTPVPSETTIIINFAVGPN